MNVYFVNAGCSEERDWHELDPPEDVYHWFVVVTHSRNAARYAVARRQWGIEYTDRMQILRLAKNVNESAGIEGYNYGHDTPLVDRYWPLVNEDKISYFRAD